MTESTQNLALLLRGDAETAHLPLREGEVLANHTSFRIGGACDLFVEPDSQASLVAAASHIRESGARCFVLGNGSNVLFDDGGYRGVVLSLGGIRQTTVDGESIVAGAGASLASVCVLARDNGLTGLEFAYGIPGSVGGATFMNAGAYGGEMAQVVKASNYLDLDDMTVKTLSRDCHRFGYRDSFYRHKNAVVLSTEFALSHGEKPEIAQKMADFMNRRVTKQPLEYPSAGSVFKRPEGYFAGQLIEECGLKGYRIGGAEVSEKHAGFIVNRGGATAKDVLALVEHIQVAVMKQFGVTLECEIIRVAP